ncbi:MAG: type II toxin-antitoxin system HipA family toxin [Planctomycetota bacterium]
MTLEVHVDFRGETLAVGTLHTPSRGTSVVFEYAPSWLSQSGAFAIDPTSLPLRAGPQHSPSLFSVVLDCGPDRWGRVLIERAVRRGVLERKPLREIDYVLALDDASRIGALRFRELGGAFLAASTGRLPPIVRLPALLRATDAIHRDRDSDADLRFLLGEGSPLGGARPKSAVVLDGGELGIAKFQKPDDTRDIAAGEVLALRLAANAGVRAAEARLVKVGRTHAVVVRRFDRKGNARIPFLSAATLLGSVGRESGSYSDIAEAIRRFGDHVKSDLEELWRRMVFALLVDDCDDHLRNHGFLMVEEGRWSLSPAYDVNPVPESESSRGNRTPLGEDATDFSIDHAMKLAAKFGLGLARAKQVLRKVVGAVEAWREVGRELRIPAATLAVYESAFEGACRAEARVILGR